MFKTDDNLNFNCEAFILSKHHPNIYQHRKSKTKLYVSLVYIHVSGPAPNTLAIYHYFVTFIDDAS